MNKKKYDIYTLGNTPAAIYLIDLLNKTDNKNEHSVLKSIHGYKSKFKEIIHAFDKSQLSESVVYAYINGQLLDLECQAENWKNKGYSELIINLTKNLIISDFTQFKRQRIKIKKITDSATRRAKDQLRYQNKNFNNEEVLTYGKESRFSQETLEVKVKFDNNGLPTVDLDQEKIVDHVNSQYLLHKSLKRLERLGKTTSLYHNLKK